MYTKRYYLKKIVQEFPKVHFKKVSMITKGWDDVVLILDNKLVFVFPKDPNEKDHSLQKELKILPFLNKHIHSLKIPHFVYVARDKSFAGYKIVDGEPLTRELFKTLSPKEKDRVARQIANFLKELHSFPLDIAKKNGVGLAMKQKDAFIWLQSHIQVIKKKLSKNEQKILLSLKNSHFSFIPVVAHQDLSRGHILFDKKKHRVSGIIDFGDIQISDRAGDFTKLWPYGEKFIDKVISYYGSSDEGIKDRSRYYRLILNIHMMYYGVTKKRKDYWNDAYALFKKLIVNYA